MSDEPDVVAVFIQEWCGFIQEGCGFIRALKDKHDD
jgi:hypothetical protein